MNRDTSSQLPAWVKQMDDWTLSGRPYLFILDYKLEQPLILSPEEAASQGIRFEIGNSPNREQQKGDFTFQKHPFSFDIYRQGFDRVMQGILTGDTYLLNLCYPTKLTGLPPIEEIYTAARAPYKLLVPGRFVVFSPESFVHIRDGVIRTYPMKGTISTSVPDAATRLLEDIKEQEEHATVVDLLRNDLSIVADKVKVERYRYITEIRTRDKSLLQCSTEISGEIMVPYRNRYGSLLHTILPAGSVTGAPKKKTCEIIKEAELEPRGYYTGVFGYFDGQQLSSAVMIRMIEQRAEGLYYRSGGGITYRSRPEDEYQEMIDKVYVPVY